MIENEMIKDALSTHFKMIEMLPLAVRGSRTSNGKYFLNMEIFFLFFCFFVDQLNDSHVGCKFSVIVCEKSRN